MREQIILHKFDTILENQLNHIRQDEEILDANRYTIIEFHDYCFSFGLSKSRISKYMGVLINLSKMLDKDFRQADKKDILAITQKIEKSNLGDWTKHDYKVTLKRFYKWLGGDDYYPENVRWIRTTVRNGKHKLPSEILTEDEVRKLINGASSARDRAFVSALYESGGRIAELLSLRIKDIQFDQYGASITVSGKTGMRRVRLIMSSPYLLEWINSHPRKEDVNSPLWVVKKISKNDKTAVYSYLKPGASSILLKRLAMKEGIKKNIYPHLFRHSRATHLSKHLTEAQMKEIFGWTQNSDMAGVYVHLSGRDVDDALLKLSGLKKDEKEDESRLRPKNCPRCKVVNPPTAKFCNSCSAALDIEAAIELDSQRKVWDDRMAVLMKNPEVQELLVRKMLELGISR